MNTKLILDNLCLQLFLGVTDEERAKKQEVLVTVEIIFLEPSLACSTGNLSDAICYDGLVQKIKKFCDNQGFTLIESLGVKLFELIKKDLPEDIKLHLKVAKQRPLPDLAQSIFEISD